MEYIYCPIKDCPHWWAWFGYLDHIIKDIKKHVRKEHELSAFSSDGGIVDEIFGARLAEPRRPGT